MASGGNNEELLNVFQNELESLKKDLNIEGGSAAEALLSSKILQLEQQMQNMQVWIWLFVIL